MGKRKARSIHRAPGFEVFWAGVRVGVEGWLALGHVIESGGLGDNIFTCALTAIHGAHTHVLARHGQAIDHLQAVRHMLGLTGAGCAQTLLLEIFAQVFAQLLGDHTGCRGCLAYAVTVVHA